MILIDLAAPCGVGIDQAAQVGGACCPGEHQQRDEMRGFEHRISMIVMARASLHFRTKTRLAHGGLAQRAGQASVKFGVVSMHRWLG
jgi:hypothetical protein